MIHTQTANDMKLAAISVMLNIVSYVNRTDVSFWLSTVVSCLAIVYYLIKIKQEKNKV